MTQRPTGRAKKGSVRRIPTRQKQQQAPPVKKERRPMAESPQIGALTPEEFEAIGREALGEARLQGRGWQKAFLAGTGLAQSTLTRYLRGIFPIPQHIAVIMEMLQTLRNNGLPVPEAFTIKNNQNE